MLRGHRMSDFGDSFALWSDPSVTRFIGGRPFSEEEVWIRLLRYAGSWAQLGFGFWAVFAADTGAFVGEVGFADYRRDLQPSIHGTPEIGWALMPAAQGRGIATEAVRAAVAWGDDKFADPRTVCIIDPGNLPSLRVAEKLGYRAILQTVYKGDPTLLFERLRG